MIDTKWYIGSDPIITANGKLGDYAELERGRTVTFEFYFSEDLVDSQTSLAGSYAGTLGMGYGGTLGGSYGTSAQYISDYVSNYIALREYTEYTSGISADTDIDGVPYYRERTPSIDPVSTHVVKIIPGDGVSSHPGVWGLIVGGTDRTEILGSQARLDVSVFVLGDTTEYGSLSEVENQLRS